MVNDWQDWAPEADSGPRECGGSRKESGIYWELGFAPPGQGKPLEWFALDPAVPLPEGFEPPAQGVVLVEVDGVFHVFDHIGSEHWPLPTDWLEEVRRKGVSAYLPAGTDFSKLSADSLYYPVHERGRLTNAAELAALVERQYCPAGREGVRHDGADFGCTGWHYECLPGKAVEGAARQVVRELKTFAYVGRAAPEGFGPQYEPGIIGRFPLGRLAVVKGETAAASFAAASQARGVRVNLVEE